MTRKIINIFLIIILISLVCFIIWKTTPLSANYFYNKGKQFYFSELYDDSIEMFEQALKVSPDNEAYQYFYVAALTKAEPTYFIQEKLYAVAHSKICEMAKNLAKSHNTLLRKELLEGLEDNYIINAIATKEIVHWNLEDFPIKVYVQNTDAVPKYYNEKILSALKEWKDRTGFIDFVRVNSQEKSNIDIIYKDLPKTDCDKHGCPYIIGTTEHEIDSNNVLKKVTITMYKANPFGHEFLAPEIYHTAVHELGHALGIMGHSDNSSDIMYSNNNKIYDLFSPQRPRVLDISMRDLMTITLLYKIFPTVTNSKIKNIDKYLYGPLVIGEDSKVLNDKLAELKKYVSRYPNVSTGYINISGIYNQLGEYEQALEVLNTAENLSNSFDEDFLIQYNRAVIYFNMQEFDKASEYALLALEIKPDKNLSEMLNEIKNIKNELK